ncbi:DUF4190 domain-containing protein [Streptomyces seoulensis]|uniref:DUF4190 domain-containing protein n=1 Tax=Streptomyces seoulensis TaxID=73044 RepID=UPI000B2DF917|nr:DUF4190 domain-containing protein [Streptomyces seoulensis]
MSISPAREPGDPQGPQSPYGSPSPYWTPAPPTPTNPFAIASLVTGILCCVPGVGLLLGVVALLQIRKRGQRGLAAAVVGSTLSGIALVTTVLLLTTGAPGWIWRNVKDGVRESANLSLAKGDCFDTDDGRLKDAVYGVRTVPCAGAHEGEVFGTFTLADGPYPGEKAVRDAAERCVDQRQFYAMDEWAVPQYVDAVDLSPSRETWAFGDRTVTCVFSGVTGHGTLTGSLRADQTTLNAHQIAFLDAARTLNDAMGTAPDAVDVEDDLPGHKAWARRVSTVLADGAHALRAHAWPATARAPLAALTARMDKARAQWDQAARAGDADAFYLPYDAGLTLIEPRAVVPARKALKLATTPPGGGAEV